MTPVKNYQGRHESGAFPGLDLEGSWGLPRHRRGVTLK